MADGRKTTIIELPSLIQSTIVAIMSSCDNCCILRIEKTFKSFVSFPAFLTLDCTIVMMVSLAPVPTPCVKKQKRYYFNFDKKK